ncbi:MAG: amidohydrolase family protein [Opitutaceae bacterium]|jgi:predicted TIM-barrel fold metal-dependent hydrolase
MNLIDTHQHLWELERFPCSWCAGIPLLNRSFTLSDYRLAAAGLGIVKTVFVECDVDEPRALDEARHVQTLASGCPLIAGIVAGVRPEHPGFRRHLEQLAGLPQVRGVRRVLHTQPDEVSRSGMFVENLRLLPEFGYSFDLCVLSRQLPLAIAIVKACPGVPFILDHCGVPDVKGRAFDPWRDRIRALARFPNVVCKVSGLVAYADPGRWSVDQLRPWFDHCLECFGWDRLIWGGDWPVCTQVAALSEWVGAALSLAGGATREQQAAFFQHNAERVYRI